MANQKANNLPVYVNFPTAAVSGTVYSQPTNIFTKDDIGIQVNWTGTLAGTFQVQVSADYEQDSSGNIMNAGNWTDLVVYTPTATTTFATASGSPGTGYFDIYGISAPWIRWQFVYSSGAGNIEGFILGKAI